ncbi:DNA pilot protein [robinz microvirus RP_103]|nr:DNA pilot protein [robinz microvirus RP_103]
MLPLLGGLITGGASLLGNMFSSQTSAANTAANIGMQRETNFMSAQESQKNRDFQDMQLQNQRAYETQMSNSAYQRASGDMKAAGLNPMMMFGSGGPASTPSTGAGSGSTASFGTARSENTSPWAGLGDAAAKAVSGAVQLKTMDKMSDEMANLEVENRRLSEVVSQVGAQTATERARKANVEAQTENVRQDTVKGKLDRARQEWEAIKHIDLSSIPDVARRAGNIGAWGGGKIGETVSPLISGATALKRLLPQKSTRETSGWSSKHGDYQSFDEMWSGRIGR